MEAPFSRTLADLIFEQAERYGARPAVIWQDQVISYSELCTRAARIAASLRARGIARGDRVGLLINNRPEWLEAFFGTMIAGGVVVAFSTWSTADELDWLIAGFRRKRADRAGPVRRQRLCGGVAPAGAGGCVPAIAGGLPRYPALRDIVLLGDSYDRLRAAAPMARPGSGDRTRCRGRRDHHLHLRLQQPAEIGAAVAWRHHREWLQHRRAPGLSAGRSRPAGAATVLVLWQRQRDVGRADAWRRAGAARHGSSQARRST